MTSNQINWKTVVMTAGAFTAFNIGSGFASGQEVLQFFGSWGGIWPLITPLIAFVGIAICATSAYRSGSIHQFANPSDAYPFYFGKYLSRFADVFTILLIFGQTLVMFAGCGETIHQYFGIPVYIGSLLLGLAAVLVVWFGLEKVTQVLGVSGLIIIAFVVVIGVYSVITADTGIFEAERNVPDYVASGQILQTTVFGIKNPILAGCFYAGLVFFSCFLFVIGCGKDIGGTKTAAASGIASSIVFTAGVYLVCLAVLFNIDYIVETGSKIPMLSVISKNLPQLHLIFTLIIICGIYTTVVGFLWTIGRRFAPDKSAKQRIIITAVTIAGIFLGSVIPFDKMLNFVTPWEGCIGFIFIIVILANEYKRKRAGKNTCEPACEPYRD